MQEQSYFLDKQKHEVKGGTVMVSDVKHIPVVSHTLPHAGI